MCNEIIIIAKGRLIACDTADNLERKLQPKAVLEVETDATREESEAVIESLSEIERADFGVSDEGFTKITITVAAENELELRKQISLRFASSGRAVLKNDRVKADLEEIFMELTNPETTQEDDGEEERI